MVLEKNEPILCLVETREEEDLPIDEHYSKDLIQVDATNPSP